MEELLKSSFAGTALFRQSSGSSTLRLSFFSVAFVYFILSRLSYLAFSANLGLLYMPHPGMGPLA